MEKMLGLNGGEASLNGGDEGFNGNAMNGGEGENTEFLGNANSMEGGRRRRRRSGRKSARKSRRSSSKSRRGRRTRKRGGNKKDMTGLATVGTLIAAQHVYGRRNKKAVSAVSKRRSRRGRK